MRSREDAGLEGIDREDRRCVRRAHTAHDGFEAPYLFPGVDRNVPGPRRFGADIDDVGARGDEVERVGDGIRGDGAPVAREPLGGGGGGAGG